MVRRYYSYGRRLRLGCRSGGRAVIDWEHETEDGEVETYRIEGRVSDYDPGVTSGPPDRCYPPEGGEVEIDEIILVDEDGNESAADWKVFSSKEMEAIERELADNVEEPEPPEPDPDDYRYGRKRYW